MAVRRRRLVRTTHGPLVGSVGRRADALARVRVVSDRHLARIPHRLRRAGFERLRRRRSVRTRRSFASGASGASAAFTCA